jgi:protein-tyrosine phosphatase
MKIEILIKNTARYYSMNGCSVKAFFLLTSYICHMKILMVCLGNICRSPLAEGILQHKVNQKGLNWIVESAGTNGFHVGEPPHRLSQKVAKLNGIDISHQQCRRFVKEDFNRFDIIYPMAADIIEEMRRIAKEKYDDSKVKLLLNESFPGENRDIPDPWYGTEPGYHAVFDLIAGACDAIIKKYE